MPRDGPTLSLALRPSAAAAVCSGALFKIYAWRFVPSAIGLAIHAFIALFVGENNGPGAASFRLGLMFVAGAPYVIAGMITMRAPRVGMAFAIAVLVADMYAVYTGLIKPRGSTASGVSGISCVKRVDHYTAGFVKRPSYRIAN